ncbi:MAG: hypothetical protein ACE5M4_09870 [Anaerolineales bacterium]
MSRSRPGPISWSRVQALRPEQAIVLVILLLYLVVLVRTAWMSDDAYFTFRTISNFAAGQGLVWNVGERVQAYTHPLWMIVVAAGVFSSHEFYYTSLAISIVVSTAAAVVFWRWIARTPMMAVLGLIVLVMSRAFVDYSTSGLENPLSHLLAASYLAVYFGSGESKWKLPALTTLASLAALNRLDTLPIYLPSLLVEYVRIWRQDGFPFLALLGFLPLVVWEAFSVVYYGFPLPNTAYAKLVTGLPPGDLVEQGIYYLMNSVNLDPVTLIVILAGIVAAVGLLRGGTIPLALGVALFLFYIVRIGGDFMSGRFLGLPLLFSVSILARVPLPDRWAVAGLALLVAAGLASPAPPLLSGVEYGSGLSDESIIDGWGIADERALYYPDTGLLQARRHISMPNHALVHEGIAARDKGEPGVVRHSSGFFGFYAGRDIHVMDILGLGDPLLARLPPRPDPFWRIGHFERGVPEGYPETLLSGENRIAEPHLAEYYDKLATITRGPLISSERLGAVIRMNLGAYDHLLQEYLDSLPRSVSLPELSGPEIGVGETTNLVPTAFSSDGIRIDLLETQHARRAAFRLERSTDYTVIFSREGQEVARKLISRSYGGEPGLSDTVVGLSAQEAGKGYDTITLYPVADGKELQIESVTLLDS